MCTAPRNRAPENEGEVERMIHDSRSVGQAISCLDDAPGWGYFRRVLY